MAEGGLLRAGKAALVGKGLRPLRRAGRRRGARQPLAAGPLLGLAEALPDRLAERHLRPGRRELLRVLLLVDQLPGDAECLAERAGPGERAAEVGVAEVGE